MRTLRPLVIDANAVITRCIMATASEDAAGRVFTGGVHHSTLMVADLVTLSKADHVVAFFDGEVPSWRKELVPEYKVRSNAEDRLGDDYEAAFQQIHDCFELWPLLGMTCLTYAQLEADDAVAAAVRVFAGNDREPLVMTSDADLFQCCAMGAEVWDLAHTQWVTTENFVERTGVTPSTYVLYRALVGDASDKIKGAHGVGPAKAKALLDECKFGEVEPREQLARLCKRLRNRQGKPKVFEQNIVAQQCELERIIAAIDLSDSFGKTRRLARCLSDRTPIRKLEFLRACRRLGLNGVLGTPNHFVRPFEQARDRLDETPEDAL